MPAKSANDNAALPGRQARVACAIFASKLAPTVSVFYRPFV
ncbi:hypothetical protein C4K03_2594 [Pseudomonas synxantha]|uniref:Uncharacterized protein n=1 Tax=Pseudomonas synxantha TaxID=47883 RepID=A0A3G7U846_9PSED|nr:hypothetical protein C4K03_2594 [Pseudomonas synxantha]